MSTLNKDKIIINNQNAKLNNDLNNNMSTNLMSSISNKKQNIDTVNININININKEQIDNINVCPINYFKEYYLFRICDV
jgi:hypothetical protein